MPCGTPGFRGKQFEDHSSRPRLPNLSIAANRSNLSYKEGRFLTRNAIMPPLETIGPAARVRERKNHRDDENRGISLASSSPLLTLLDGGVGTSGH
ncbi:hypothetical protein TNCV_4296951 [Trichonephila clavipes]|nr:hypothetical protein TNCV_4296951 [Trichonephila clavipes]